MGGDAPVRLPVGTVWTAAKVVSQMRASPERGDVAVRADAYLWQHAGLADQAFRIWRGRGPLVHELKTWPVPFDAVWSGAKRAEMRRFVMLSILPFTEGR